MSIIYWFRRDRRLCDNPAFLKAIALANEAALPLLPVTLEPENPNSNWGFARLGAHRLAFEAQSLRGLANRLQTFNSGLYQPVEPGINGLIKLAHQLPATAVVCEAIYAHDEQQEIELLKNAGIKVLAIEQSALLPHNDLPFDPTKAPVVFSDFRRQVEKSKCLPRSPLDAPAQLPSLPGNITAASPYKDSVDAPALDRRSAFPYQ